jgi:hypothetical protein
MPILREQLESENDPFSYTPESEKSGISQCGDNHPETTPETPVCPLCLCDSYTKYHPTPKELHNTPTVCLQNLDQMK